MRGNPRADVRLFPVAVATWVGAWLATERRECPREGQRCLSQTDTLDGSLRSFVEGSNGRSVWLSILVIALLILLLALVRLCRRGRPRHAATPTGSFHAAVALIMCALACGGLSGTYALDSYNEDPLVSRTRDGPERVRMHVRLDMDPRLSSASRGSNALTGPAHTLWLERPQQTFASVETQGDTGTPSSVLINLRGKELASFFRGDVLVVTGTFDPTFPRGGAWAGTLHVDEVSLRDRPSGWQGWARNVRAAFVDICEELEPQARGLVPGMAIGDDSRLPPSMAEAMRMTSLTHVTAVSGAHVAILLGLVSPFGGRHHKRRALIQALTLAAYVTIVGPEPSVLRAAGVASVLLISSLCGRLGAAHTALAIVVIVFILIDPWMSHSWGFVMSVVATWAVLVPARAWATWVSRQISPRRLWGVLARRISETVGVCLSCQICVSPILLLLRPEWSTWGLLANVLVAPAVAPATLCALVATAMARASPWLSSSFAHVAGIFTRWIAYVATTLSHWPMATLHIPGGAGAVGLLFLLGVVSFGAWTWADKRWQIH